MTCRHGKYDTACGSFQGQLLELFHEYHQHFINPVGLQHSLQHGGPKVAELVAAPPETPDASNYEIEYVLEVNGHLVMKVRYPNCAKCSYEGTKVMVFAGVGFKDALMWRTIDPHFRTDAPKNNREAPSPVARFPGSTKGWQDALDYVRVQAER
jgi:hypothetical protein